ncbi:hypothetical protein ACS0TY_035379 [Phlomoides rotata]
MAALGMEDVTVPWHLIGLWSIVRQVWRQMDLHISHIFRELGQSGGRFDLQASEGRDLDGGLLGIYQHSLV